MNFIMKLYSSFKKIQRVDDNKRMHWLSYYPRMITTLRVVYFILCNSIGYLCPLIYHSISSSVSRFVLFT